MLVYVGTSVAHALKHDSLVLKRENNNTLEKCQQYSGSEWQLSSDSL